MDGSGRSTVTVTSIRVSETTVNAGTLAETVGLACTSPAQISQPSETAATTATIPISTGRGTRGFG